MQIHAAALCKEDSQETLGYVETNKQEETVQCYSKTYDERQGPTDERSALMLTGNTAQLGHHQDTFRSID